jgi:hypothetical protein
MKFQPKLMEMESRLTPTIDPYLVEPVHTDTIFGVEIVDIIPPTPPPEVAPAPRPVVGIA